MTIVRITGLRRIAFFIFQRLVSAGPHADGTRSGDTTFEVVLTVAISRIGTDSWPLCSDYRFH